MRRWLRLVVVACGFVAASAACGKPLTLDEFDARRHSVALPDGVRLAYAEFGDPHGRPVVLVHGFTDNARDWWPLLPYLSAQDRLIAVDLRGHGGSSRPECCYTRFDFAYDIRLLLDRLHIRRADIVGHSLGSIVTQVFAELWPERTGRVVLISSTAGPKPGQAPVQGSFDFSAEIRRLHEPLDPDSKFMLDWWSSPTPVDPEFLRRERMDCARIPLRVWFAVLDQALGAGDLRPLLPRLKAPVLLVWGSEDPIFGPEAREGLREALPGATVKVFDGLGHNPFWERPQEVADLLNGFLSPRPDGDAAPK